MKKRAKTRDATIYDLSTVISGEFEFAHVADKTDEVFFKATNCQTEAEAHKKVTTFISNLVNHCLHARFGITTEDLCVAKNTKTKRKAAGHGA